MKSTSLLDQQGSPNFQEQEIHLRDYVRVIIKRKITVITFLAITFLTVVIATFTATPYYTASSQVLIEKNIGSNKLTGGGNYIPYDPDFQTTQFELIRSPNVARRVVKQLQLDTRYRNYFFEKSADSPSFLSTITSGVKKFLSGLLPSKSDDEKTNLEEENDPLLVAAEPISDAETIASIIQGNLSINPVVNTKTVFILYSDKDPAMAKVIADAVVQAYIDETLEIKLSSSNYTLKWMTAKAEEESKKLEGSELNLQKYMRDNDLVTVEDKLAVYPQKLAEFSSQLSKAQTEQKEFEALYAQIKNLGENYQNIETISIFSDNKILQGLREKIYLAEQNIKDLSKKFGYKHPSMVNAKAEKEMLLKEKRFEIDRIVEATKNSYNLAKSKETNLTQLLTNTKQEMLNVNERFTQYSIMKREADMNRVLYDALTSSIKEVNVTDQAQDIKIWVVKSAVLPDFADKPRKSRNLALGLILGLFGGIGLAFFIEYLDNTVKNGKDIEQRFGLTVLGSIEELRDKNSKIETSIRDTPLSPVAEGYRMIRTSLLLSTPDHPPRTMLVTSMVPQEGKTSTTFNLAMILAQNEKKVLIIDCDMRRPRMHSLFAVPNSSGLSNYLAGNIEQNQLRQVEVNGLTMIPAGPPPPNPAELLNSNRMKFLLNEMSKNFDFILLDSPPLLSVTDSLTLGKLVDGTLLVTRSGKTSYDMLESGLGKMRGMKITLLGAIVNGITITKGSEGYYGYYDYYGKESE
ncbi:MAG: polysaccharide biosynthesis tyrosine autokinase [Desulfocapsaceae bacterium]|nr:polysaccharide biosynthesis tyrosine autokinase [Desulfocapsaceae bacterium]